MLVLRTALCLTMFAAVLPVRADDGHVFVLRKGNDKLVLEKAPVSEGATQVFMCNESTGNIDLILPVAPGGSGSICKLSEGLIRIARCDGEHIQVSAQSPAGKKWAGPSRVMNDLRDYDVRVCVAGSGGKKQAFLIVGYEEVVEDTVGPVIDMFAGRIPLQAGDYAIYTETYRSRPEQKAYGETPLVYDKYLFVEGMLAGGKKGMFAVDLGAGQTVVTKSWLPADAVIEQISTVQYSAAGKEVQKYTPNGATGAVQTVLGQAVLPQLRLGTLELKDFVAVVMEEMPMLNGRKIDGIIGIDLFECAEYLSIDFGEAKDQRATLRLSRESTIAQSAAVAEVPYSRMNSHLMVRAKVNAAPALFWIDTGAPGCDLDTKTADAAGVKTTSGGYDVTGLDNTTKIKAMPTKIGELQIADAALSDVDATVCAFPVFDILRGNGESCGLLGNAVLARFQRVEVDFKDRFVRFQKR